jgi:hypothetical protein
LTSLPGWRMIGSLQVPKGGYEHATYISLILWTGQGIKNYKDPPSRAADFTKLVESLGGLATGLGSEHPANMPTVRAAPRPA